MPRKFQHKRGASSFTKANELSSSFSNQFPHWFFFLDHSHMKRRSYRAFPIHQLLLPSSKANTSYSGPKTGEGDPIFSQLCSRKISYVPSSGIHFNGEFH